MSPPKDKVVAVEATLADAHPVSKSGRTNHQRVGGVGGDATGQTR